MRVLVQGHRNIIDTPIATEIVCGRGPRDPQQDVGISTARTGGRRHRRADRRSRQRLLLRGKLLIGDRGSAIAAEVAQIDASPPGVIGYPQPAGNPMTAPRGDSWHRCQPFYRFPEVAVWPCVWQDLGDSLQRRLTANALPACAVECRYGRCSALPGHAVQENRSSLAAQLLN
jgi:hypothetical protein